MLAEEIQTKFGGVDEQVLCRLQAAELDDFQRREQVLCRLQAAELDDFQRYAQRILTAATVDEVFADGE